MADAKKYSCVYHTTPAVDKMVRAFAKKNKLAKNQGLDRLIKKKLAKPPATPAGVVHKDSPFEISGELKKRLFALAARRKINQSEVYAYALNVAAGRLEAIDRDADKRASKRASEKKPRGKKKDKEEEKEEETKTEEEEEEEDVPEVDVEETETEEEETEEEETEEEEDTDEKSEEEETEEEEEES